jgi:hypothetical protein
MSEQDHRPSWAVAIEVLWRGLVGLIAIGLLVIVITRWNRWQSGPGWQSTDDAYLQSDLTPTRHATGFARRAGVARRRGCCRRSD